MLFLGYQGGRLEAGSLPCLGPGLNVWVGKEGRGFGVWMLTSLSQALWAGEGSLGRAALLGQFRLAPALPFCWLWDTRGLVERARGRAGSPATQIGGLGSWGSNEAGTAISRPPGLTLHHGLAQAMREKVSVNAPLWA